MEDKERLFRDHIKQFHREPPASHGDEANGGQKDSTSDRSDDDAKVSLVRLKIGTNDSSCCCSYLVHDYNIRLDVLRQEPPRNYSDYRSRGSHLCFRTDVLCQARGPGEREKQVRDEMWRE